MYRRQLVPCLALQVALLAAGCDKAQTLLDDAKKQAEKQFAAEATTSEPKTDAVPAPAAESNSLPTTATPADGAAPPANPMPVAPAAPSAPDSAALIALWHATPSSQRGDGTLRTLLAASPESLQDLTAFDLRSSGQYLTIAGFKLLKQFPLVKSVDCSLHPLDGEKLAALCDLSQLEDLSCASCGLTDAQLAPLKKVATLRSLNLTNNQVTDNGLAAIHNLVEVESLTLANTQVRGASLLKAKFLGNLRRINVDGSPFSQGFQALKSATNLETIDVANTAATDEHLKFLGSHKQLREIRISGNPGITDRGLSFLEGNPLLESLDIRGTSISGAGLKWLKGAKKLKALHTQETRVDPATVAALRKALPNCVID